MKLTLSGQVMGGKNNIIITRSGMRFPKPKWAAWRDSKVAEVKAQLPPNWTAIDYPVGIDLCYVAGDKRRRDFPAICDAVFHVLEKAGVVTDDTYLWPVKSSRHYSNEGFCAVTILD